MEIPNNKSSKLSPRDVSEDENSNSGTTIFHHTEKWLSEHYNIRLNVISQEIESKKINDETWSVLNENDIYIEANKSNINISANKLLAILKSSYVVPYNPIVEYFEGLPAWEGETDYISKYLSYLKLAPGQNEMDFHTQFKKWIVRTVKCATIDGYFNKQAFILSDDGIGQNIGKTSYLRSLIPKILLHYYTENLTGNDKDDKIQLSKNLIINLDEMAGLYKRDLTQLKAHMSLDRINTRLPYAKTNTNVPRIASFVGSTNETSFLIDTTGSVRWICFVIESIDFAYAVNEDIDLLWSQAFALSKNANFISEMTAEERAQNETRNSRFYSMSQEEELITHYFEVPRTDELGVVEKLSATEILSRIKSWNPNLNLRANAVQMGKYLTKLGFQQIKTNGIKKYIVKVSN